MENEKTPYTDDEHDGMERIKCRECGRVLCFANAAWMQVKCPRCGTVNEIFFKRTKETK